MSRDQEVDVSSIFVYEHVNRKSYEVGASSRLSSGVEWRPESRLYADAPLISHAPPLYVTGRCAHA